MKNVSEAPLSPAIVEQASHWLMLQWSGEFEAAQQQRFLEWRAADPEHDRAWRRLERLQSTLSGVPADTALGVLRELSAGAQAARHAAVGRRERLSGPFTIPLARSTADLRSGTGERLQRSLDDGSQLSLNSGTAVDIRYNASERRICLLAGELLLEVVMTRRIAR